jgi:hypothetical protein
VVSAPRPQAATRPRTRRTQRSERRSRCSWIESHAECWPCNSELCSPRLIASRANTRWWPSGFRPGSLAAGPVQQVYSSQPQEVRDAARGRCRCSAVALCVGLVGHSVKGALDPIGLRPDPRAVLDARRMRRDGGVSADCFDHRDVEQVASGLILTATHDPRVCGTSDTKFVPVWRLRNPLSHPRVLPVCRSGFGGSSSREGRSPLWSCIRSTRGPGVVRPVPSEAKLVPFGAGGAPYAFPPF